jgi:Leucine-rich repeat (LRR) protein
MPELHTLHLRANKIVVLAFIPDLPKLHHLNLRANLIEKLDEFTSLKSLANLKSITMHENPVATEMGDGVRKEIIMILQ